LIIPHPNSYVNNKKNTRAITARVWDKAQYRTLGRLTP